MDIIILISVAVGLISIIVLLTFLSRRSSDQNNVAIGGRGPPVRRAAGIRNARRRMQGDRSRNENAGEINNAHDRGGGIEVEEENYDDDKADIQDFSKIGAKKRAKLEAKAEKKQQREAQEKEREERRNKRELVEAELEKQREKDRIEQSKQEEAEKKALEEKQLQEHYEYLKMKEAFSVDEEGFDQDEIDEENLLQEFLQYIKSNKVVMLNDLVSHFKLKHDNVVDRIHDLHTNGSLTGVIDDRGKFIYISPMELEAVAKFVKQRGRVSITDLAENSNRLINLNPGIVSINSG